jgi:hypothetical protein
MKKILKIVERGSLKEVRRGGEKNEKFFPSPAQQLNITYFENHP